MHPLDRPYSGGFILVLLEYDPVWQSASTNLFYPSFFWYPGFLFSSTPDLGSRTRSKYSNKREGWKKFVVLATNITKFKLY
jgi:hypothetical protein